MTTIKSVPANTAAFTILNDSRNAKALAVLATASRWTKETMQHNGTTKVVYRVPGTGKAAYRTNVNACDCPDFTYRFRAQIAACGKVNKHLACKHMIAVRTYVMMGNAWVANTSQPKELGQTA